MFILLQHPGTNLARRAVSLVAAFFFLSNTVFLPAVSNAQSEVLNLPAPGTMLATSPVFTPPMIVGMTLDPQNPFQFDFYVQKGDESLEGEALREQSQRLINYFLAALTTPEEEMWVNLSPYEKDRIVADGLSRTEMGRDMLAQDYILKQLSASMMYPEEGLGSEFWKRVYAKAQERFGAAAADIPTNTFNKIWIVPEKADVYVHGRNVFVAGGHLKVMLEEDYLALDANKG